MKFEFPSEFLAVVISMSGFLAVATDSPAQQTNRASKSKGDEKAWVKQIEPGVRLYGQVPEFAEIGQSNWFDVSADGQTIAFSGGNEVQFWDIEKRKVEQRLDLRGPATTFDYSPDGMLLLINVGENVIAAIDPSSQGERQHTNFIGVWDAITREKIFDIKSSAGKDPVYGPTIRHQAVSPDGAMVAIGYGPKTQVYDVRTGDKICEIAHRQYVQSIAFMPDGKQLIDSLGDQFDVNSGQENGELPNRFARKFFNAIRVHPSQNVIVAVSWDQGIIAWNLDNEQPMELEKLPDNTDQFFAAEFSNNGRYLAAATYGSQGEKPARLLIWDFESGKLLNNFPLRSGNLVRMRFSADSRKLFTKSMGESGLSEWNVDVDRKKESEKLVGNAGPISGFQFSANGKTILASTNQGNSVVFDLKTGRPIDHIYAQSTSHLDMTSDGKYALLAALYNSAVVYDCEAGSSKSVRIRSFQRASLVTRLSSRLTGRATEAYEDFAINSGIIADDNQHFLVASRGQRYFRWEKFELNSGRSIAQKRFRIDKYWEVDDNQHKHHWQERSTSIAPNGQWLAIVNHNHDVFVIDAESGVLLHHLEDAGGTPCKIFFTPDSSMMLVVAENSVRVWDVESGAELDPAIKMESTIAGIAISRDGDRLAVLSNAKPAAMKVFDLENRAEVYSRSLKGDNTAIGISEAGQQVALAKVNCQFELLDIAELAGR